MLKMLHLSNEEIEQKTDEYYQYAERYYPNLPNLSNDQYVDLREKCLHDDKNAEKLLKDYAFRVAINEIIYIYTHRDCLNYEFGDAVGDAFIKIHKVFEKLLNAENLSAFKLYTSKNAMKEFACKFESLERRNFDLYELNNGKTREALQNIEDCQSQYDIEDNVENVELKDITEKSLSFLKAKQIKVIKMFYGIDKNCQMNLDDIGRVYGVSGSNIGDVYLKGMKKLRRPMMKFMIENNIFEFDPQLKEEQIEDCL